MKNTVLITGAAGFIGYHLAKRLLKNNYKVIGYDNMNNYYSVELKEDRVKDLAKYDGFTFIQGSLEDYRRLEKLFITYKPESVINLAAQAGVRFSLENPRAYIDSNIVGFFNVLQCCREFPIEHLIFASSSSVYGNNKEVPYTEDSKLDKPECIYAATKLSDEAMAYSYSKLFGIPTTGLRLFTVYGPFGRPDMAYFSFTKNINENKEIQLFNNGDMFRDYTYIDDVVECIIRLLNKKPDKDDNDAPYKVYNIGNGKPESLGDMVEAIETFLEKKARKKLMPMQKGDVFLTYSNNEQLRKAIDYVPQTSLQEGICKFVLWYKKYYEE